MTIEELQLLQFSSNSEILARIKSDNTFKMEIRTLYKRYFGKDVSGCDNCMADAFIELRYFNKKIMTDRKYKIRAGAVIYDTVNQDASKIMTNANCTDELAEYHLRHNPGCRKFFIGLPEDFELDSVDEAAEKAKAEAAEKAKAEAAEKAKAKAEAAEKAKAEAAEKAKAKTVKLSADDLKMVDEMITALNAGSDREFLKENLTDLGYSPEDAEVILVEADKKISKK